MIVLWYNIIKQLLLIVIALHIKHIIANERKKKF